MKKIETTKEISLNMTPMIDIVFMLLAFFIMTFKFAEPEGDFAIRMPLGPSQNLETKQPPLENPLHVRLLATPTGDLAEIRLGNRSLGTDFGQLRAMIFQSIGGDAPPEKGKEFEVELDPDEELHYEHTIAAFTAISGYIKDGRIHPLVDKIRFHQRQRPGIASP